jgi:flavin-dependent dehydrogenase
VDTCDVLVVGGGPAGSSCARGLAAGGLDVVVLDRAAFPRHKICAGWVAPRVFATLGVDLGEYGKGRTLEPFTGFRLGLWGGPRVEVRYPEPVSYGVVRAEFDHFLLRRSGARLRLGEPLEHLEGAGGRWVANGAIAAPLLVGAGGHACPVARHVGARGGPAVAAREAEFPAEGRVRGADPATPELWFTHDLRGYGWCLRKGDRLNVGLGLEGARDLNEQASRFHVLLSEIVGCCLPDSETWDGCAYRLWGRGPARLVWDGVVLVGDAAGLAHPRSGEGIGPAVDSGLLAARAILGARGNYRAERLRPYEDALRARLGPAGGVGDAPPSAIRRAAARLLLRSRTLAGRVVLDRWFLRQGEPPLPGGLGAAGVER